jgi:hypothetical protein
MVELLAAISFDVRTDGILDNLTSGSQLVDNAVAISLPDVRRYLESKYAELNREVTIPDFEQYVRQFLANTSYQQTSFITYPAQGRYGDNILSEETASVIAGEYYSMSADIPSGFSLKVVLKGGLWAYSTFPPPTNWNISVYNYTTETQDFTAIEGGKTSDLHFYPSHGRLNNTDNKYYTTIEYYENDATTPVRTKQLEIITNNVPPENPADSMIMLYDDNWTNPTKELHHQNKNKVSISEGLWGTVVKTECNYMPPITEDSVCTQSPVIREIAVYEYTTVDQKKMACMPTDLPQKPESCR